MSFIIVKEEVANDRNLNMNEVVAYSRLRDRMKSSLKRRDTFYDSKCNDYYVIFKLDEMREKIHVSKPTMVNIYNHLVELGYIIRKKQFNSADKIFLPRFNKTDESKDSLLTKVKKLKPNQKTLNQKQYNTVNTEKDDHESTKQKQLTSWINSTHSVIGLTMSTLKSITNFGKNKIKSCKKLVRIILNARNSVAIKAKIARTAVTQFESNRNLQDDLGKHLNHIFTYVRNKKMTSYYGYITNALKDYFKISFGLAKPIKVVQPDKQQVRFNNGKTRIKETLPDWAKDNYQPQYKKAPLEVRKAVRAKLAKLNAEK